MTDFLLYLLLLLSFSFFSYKRLLTYLHYFQQEEYDSLRFLSWLWQKRTFDKQLSLVLLVISAGLIFAGVNLWAGLVLPILFLFVGYREIDPRKTGKKKLVFTSRAKRIFYLSWALMFWGGFFCTLEFSSPLAWLIPLHLIPFSLVLSTWIWSFYEKNVQQEYWNEAKAKLKDHKPFIIGITGSFGKTSVKHILGHILQMTAPTLWTPGSVNTPMGITRIVRERLTDKHKYFIVEMGAYGPGSISRLCQLTPPDMGIITAIGPAHYERFKTLETVAEAKFELAHNVVKRNEAASVIASSNTLRFSAAEGFATLHSQNLISCGTEETYALTIESIEQTPKGLDVRLIWEGKKHILKAPLFGLHHGENVALAFAAACGLGIDPATIVTALKSVSQIPHRLEVKPQPNGSTLIDDAFNSNPSGFSSALTLLDTLGKHHLGKRILITPGMVELGAAHEKEHEKIAKQALKTTDIVLAIAPKRIESFVSTYEKGAKDKRALIRFDNFAQAQQWMSENVSAGDVILLENDLPDFYESVPSL